MINKSNAKLLYCPFCKFDDVAYAKHIKETGFYASKRETIMPMLYLSRFLNRWVIECQNCGVEVLFNLSSESEHVEAWNNLQRVPRNHE